MTWPSKFDDPAMSDGATDQQRVLDSEASNVDHQALVHMVVMSLSELGMYGTALDGSASWAICALCQHPIHQPEPGYTREQANEDLARHLHETHGAEVWDQVGTGGPSSTAS